MKKDIGNAIAIQAQGLIEDWLYSGWENRDPIDYIQGHDDGTASLEISDREDIILADEYYEQAGAEYLAQAFKESGSLLSLIQSASSLMIMRHAQSLAREAAEALESDISELEAEYEGWRLASVGKSDPHGWAPPVRISERIGFEVTEYRGLDGSLDSDVVLVQVTVCGEYGATLEVTMHATFHKDKES